MVQEKPPREREETVFCKQLKELRNYLGRMLDSATRRELYSRSCSWQTPINSREQTSLSCRGDWEGKHAYLEGTVQSLLQLRKPLKDDRLRFSKA